MKKLIFFFITYSITINATAGEILCSNVLNPKTKVPAFTDNSKQPLSTIARTAGVEYLMMKMPVSYFGQITSHLGRNSSVEVPSAYTLDPQSLHGVDLTLKPVLKRDQGLWAHQMIRNGSDMIGMGVRTVPVKDWQIGLLFPVEILDIYPMTIGHTRNMDARVHGSEQFDLSERSHEDFAKLITQIANQPAYPGSNDVHLDVYFKAKESSSVSLNRDVKTVEGGIPLSLMELLWIPAPLLNSIFQGEREFQGSNDPLLSNTFKMQISVQDSNADRGWRDIDPPTVNTLSHLDTDLRIGTWFNVVPDWGVVRKALKNNDETSAAFLLPEIE